MDKPPTCWMIAGPNGAGKTTFALKYLPEVVNCRNFVNADAVDITRCLMNLSEKPELIFVQRKEARTIINQPLFKNLLQSSSRLLKR